MNRSAWKEWRDNKDLDMVPFDQLLQGNYVYDSTLGAQSTIDLKEFGFKSDCLPPVTMDDMKTKHSTLWWEYQLTKGIDPERVRTFYLDNLPTCLQDEQKVDVCIRAKVAVQARLVDKKFARLISKRWDRWAAMWKDGVRHFWKYYKISSSGMNLRQLFNKYLTIELEESCKARGLALMDCPEVCKKVLKASIRTNKVVNK